MAFHRFIRALLEGTVIRLFGDGGPALEASGGISLDNVRRFAETGIDRISIGALTHSAPILDISLEIQRG